MNSPSKKYATGSIQVSFIIHSVKGEHLDSQAVIVSVDDNTFLLKPRTEKGDTRYYETGHTTFVNCQGSIRFAVGIVTPNRTKYFFHSFSYIDFKPSVTPTLQKITMKTPAQSYEIYVSLFSTISPYQQYSTMIGSNSRISSLRSISDRTVNSLTTHNSPKKSYLSRTTPIKPF